MVKFLNEKTSGFEQFSKMQAEKVNVNKKGGIGLVGWMFIVLIFYWIFAPAKKVDVPVIANQPPIDVSAVPRTTVSNDKIAATIQGLRISNINLEGHKVQKNETENIELLSDDGEFIELGFLASGTNVPEANTVWNVKRSPNESKMSWKSDSGVVFNRTISVDQYVLSVSDEIKNTNKKPIFISQYGRIVRDMKEKNKLAVRTGGVANVGGDIETESWDRIVKKSPIYQVAENKPAFVGFTDQYWETIVSLGQTSAKTIKFKQKADKVFQSEIAPEVVKIDAGQTTVITSNIFAGPKTQSDLKYASTKIQHIDSTIDYGFFGFLSRPFLWTLNRVHDLVPNYGIAIILLTLIIRGFMWPLTRKSTHSMLILQKLQPEMQKIQKLYANDKIKMQQEVMKLYQANKANPFSSIGMMFLQIPIFFALYKALLVAVPLRHAGFLWINDLSVMDPYYIMPILMGLTMWVQNKLNKNNATLGAMKFLPFLFTFLFAWMPSGLVLYWTVSNIVGIIQLKILKK
jgi:YidC/Oxa1 family membrane protein insertase